MMIAKYGEGPYHLDAFWTDGLFERAGDQLDIVCGEDGKPMVFHTEQDARDYIDARVAKADQEGYRFALVTA